MENFDRAGGENGWWGEELPVRIITSSEMRDEHIEFRRIVSVLCLGRTGLAIKNFLAGRDGTHL